MDLKDISFELPEELIAQAPSQKRGEDRLLVLKTASGVREHRMFTDLPGLLEPGTVCVVNNSKVRKARLHVTDDKDRVHPILLSHPDPDGHWAFLIDKAARLKPGQEFRTPDGGFLTLARREDELWWGKFSGSLDEDYFQRYGHVPLPPYIQRPDEEMDEERYQTVYADQVGSAAAPTAGLHFTQKILDELESQGVKVAPVTLHVGLGTFLPIHAQDILAHKMHREEYEISPETAAVLNAALREKRRILAVGTTSLRTLEAAWTPDLYQPGRDSTDIYITPGHNFRCTRFLLTNFHTPGSTLLLLVGALAGLDMVLETYQEAVRERYMFFSYGDAMLFDPD